MSSPEHLHCEEVMSRLWAFIDHELTPEWTEKIRAHLRACAQCFPQYDFQRAFLLFLRRHGETPAPPELRRRIFKQILTDSASGDAARGGPGTDDEPGEAPRPD